MSRAAAERRDCDPVQVLLGGLQGLRQGLVLQVLVREARDQSRRKQTIPMHRRRLPPAIQHTSNSIANLNNCHVSNLEPFLSNFFLHVNANLFIFCLQAWPLHAALVICVNLYIFSYVTNSQA